MQSKSDTQLLREYAEQGSELAFTEIVTRHTNVVYSAAVRQVDLPDMAAEITQSVFVGLARGARTLSLRLAEDASLAGWLCRSARNISLNFRRNEFRQHSRERQAMEQLNPISETAPDWEHLRPVLDEAMSELSESDYDAVVMRFFNNQDLRSVGRALGVTDDTAQKRVSRALDKLREHLCRRGISSTASALSIVLSANAVQAAPAGLAATISSVAILAGTTIITTLTTTKAIAMTTFQKALISTIVVASVVAPLVVQHQAQARLHDQGEALRRRADQLAQLQRENTGLSNLLTRTESSQPVPNEQFNEVLRLRSQVGRLQAAVQELRGRQTNEPLSREEVLASMRQMYLDRVNRLKQLFAANPAEAVPELQYLTDRDWLGLVEYDYHRLDPDNRHTMGNARTKARIHFAKSMLISALHQYARDNNGQFPTALPQLASYFNPPVDDSVLQDWTILPTTSLPSGLRGDEAQVITQKAPINAESDQRIVVGLTTWHLGAGGTNDWGPVH